MKFSFHCPQTPPFQHNIISHSNIRPSTNSSLARSLPSMWQQKFYNFFNRGRPNAPGYGVHPTPVFSNQHFSAAINGLYNQDRYEHSPYISQNSLYIHQDGPLSSNSYNRNNFYPSGSGIYPASGGSFRGNSSSLHSIPSYQSQQWYASPLGSQQSWGTRSSGARIRRAGNGGGYYMHGALR